MERTMFKAEKKYSYAILLCSECLVQFHCEVSIYSNGSHRCLSAAWSEELKFLPVNCAFSRKMKTATSQLQLYRCVRLIALAGAFVIAISDNL